MGRLPEGTGCVGTTNVLRPRQDVHRTIAVTPVQGSSNVEKLNNPLSFNVTRNVNKNAEPVWTTTSKGVAYFSAYDDLSEIWHRSEQR